MADYLAPRRSSPRGGGGHRVVRLQPPPFHREDPVLAPPPSLPPLGEGRKLPGQPLGSGIRCGGVEPTMRTPEQGIYVSPFPEKHKWL
jgi:hypothetical protein